MFKEDKIMITACIVVRNEDKYIKECLESLKTAVDEIVIIDGFSTDNTVNICKEYTDKIYYRKPQGFVEPDRPFSLQKASGDWILVIDGDERLSNNLQINLKNLTKQTKYQAYAFPRRNYYDEEEKKWIKHVLYPDYQIRLFKSNCATYKGVIHERPIIDGVTKYLTDIHHIIHLVPNHFALKKIFKHHAKYAKIQANQTERLKPKVLYFAKAIFMFILIFNVNFIYRKGFLDGMIGFKASFMLGFYNFLINWYMALKR